MSSARLCTYVIMLHTYIPQSFKSILLIFLKLVPLVRVCNRQFSQTAVRNTEVPSGQFQKLKTKQKKFQLDDGLPVYLKGGLMDKMLFQLTAAGTTVGVILGIQVFVQLALK